MDLLIACVAPAAPPGSPTPARSRGGAPEGFARALRGALSSRTPSQPPAAGEESADEPEAADTATADLDPMAALLVLHMSGAVQQRAAAPLLPGAVAWQDQGGAVQAATAEPSAAGASLGATPPSDGPDTAAEPGGTEAASVPGPAASTGGDPSADLVAGGPHQLTMPSMETDARSGGPVRGPSDPAASPGSATAPPAAAPGTEGAAAVTRLAEARVAMPVQDEGLATSGTGQGPSSLASTGADVSAENVENSVPAESGVGESDAVASGAEESDLEEFGAVEPGVEPSVRPHASSEPLDAGELPSPQAHGRDPGDAEPAVDRPTEGAAPGRPATTGTVDISGAADGPGLDRAVVAPSATQPAGEHPGPASLELVERITAAIERLGAAPARRMVLEAGAVRLAIALSGETVRVTVLAGDAGTDVVWRRDLAETLSARGLTLASDGDPSSRGDRDHDPDRQRHTPQPSHPMPASPTSRAPVARDGVQL